MRTPLVLATVLVACTPIAVTPPGRTLALDSPSGPARGTDVGVEIGHAGQIFGPEATLGEGRLRHTLEPGVVGEVDGGTIHITNSGQGPNSYAATGRLGLLLQSAGQHAALGFGLGGGTSAVGTWSSVDAGVMLGGTWRYLRPVLGGWVGYSAPLSRHPFTVSYGDDEAATLQLPHNAFVQVNAGLEFGPPECALVVGLSVMNFWLREDSRVHDGVARTSGTTHTDDTPGELSQGFASVGIGLRLSL